MKSEMKLAVAAMGVLALSAGAWAGVGSEASFNASLSALRGQVAPAADELNKSVDDALNCAKDHCPAGNPFDAEAALAAMDPAKIGVAARFVAIKPGTFLMGSPQGEGEQDETPQHQVTLTRPFEMQATDVTQLQYLLVTSNNPSAFAKAENCPGKLKVIAGIAACVDSPVETVSWNDAQAFIARLNAIQDKYTYRLPTEAEWEYAARAEGGSVGGSWTSENSGNRTHEVASRASNGFGLYDMLGNVWQWVQDYYGGYPRSAVTDPQGPSTGSYRVIRGGSWYGGAGYARPGIRNSGGPGGRGNLVGLRLVRSSR
jgi:formylglycine-generating enzyme required for sulfatase activity